MEYIKRKKQERCELEIYIGGDAKITVQSMTNTDTRDVEATVNQIKCLRISAVTL